MTPEKEEIFFNCSAATYKFYDLKQMINLCNVQFLPDRAAMRIN